MFDFFNTRKIAALEAQIATLVERLEKIESAVDVTALEEKMDNYIDNRVDIAVENAVDRYDLSHAVEESMREIDFAELAQEAIEEVINNASLSLDVRF